MASGVKVDEAVKIKYDDIKKKKNHRYLVFYIKDEKMICVEKVGSRDTNYGQFLADLTACGPDDCRYFLLGSELVFFYIGCPFFTLFPFNNSLSHV